MWLYIFLIQIQYRQVCCENYAYDVSIPDTTCLLWVHFMMFKIFEGTLVWLRPVDTYVAMKEIFLFITRTVQIANGNSLFVTKATNFLIVILALSKMQQVKH